MGGVAMGKAPNPQATLKLLFTMLFVVGLTLFVAKNVFSLLESPGSVTSVMTVALAAVALFRKFHQLRSKAEQEAMLIQQQTFFSEVESAWQRSHPREIKHREMRERHQQAETRQVEVPEVKDASPVAAASAS